MSSFFEKVDMKKDVCVPDIEGVEMNLMQS